MTLQGHEKPEVIFLFSFMEQLRYNRKHSDGKKMLSNMVSCHLMDLFKLSTVLQFVRDATELARVCQKEA